MYSTIFWKAWYVATVIGCTFNPLIFYLKSLFSRMLTQSLDFTRKFFSNASYSVYPCAFVQWISDKNLLDFGDTAFCRERKSGELTKKL